jgi:hypothetical protein
MKRLLLVIAILSVLPLLAQAQVPINLSEKTVSTLPAAADVSKRVYRVTDGQTVTDCTSGGGSIKVWCQSDGSTWTAVTANLVPSSRQVNGHALTSDVTVTADDVLPSQTGNNGKFITTNGTTASWATAGSGVTSVGGTSPIASSGGTTPSISIANAAADGSTKGAASFTAADFDASSGNISIDYTNGQAADATHKGFLTSTDWSTFNGKGSGTVTSIATTGPITGGTITGTGTIACATCATTTNGGALSATSPVTISAAGVIACATCLTGNQSITLSGDVSGSGTTAITTAIGANKVTNAMTDSTVDGVGAVSTGSVNGTATTDVQLLQLTIPAGYFNNSNQIAHIRASGTWTTGTTQTPTQNFKVKLCTVSGCGSGTALTLVTMTSAAATASTTQTWIVDADLGTVSTGSSGTVIAHGFADLPVGSSANTIFSGVHDVNTAASSAIDLTAQLFLQLTWQVSTQSGTKNSAIGHLFSVKLRD